MIDFNKPDELSRSDLKMIEQAIRNKWDINEKLFSSLPALAEGMAFDQDRGDRARCTAIRILMEMHKQNQDADSPQSSDVYVNVGVAVDQAREVHKQLVHDEDYLDYLRASTRDGDAGLTGHNGQSGALENGSAP